MKKNKIFIFKPNTLELDNIGFLEGFSRKINGNLAFYITNHMLLDETPNTIGYCSEVTPSKNLSMVEDSEWLHINNITKEIKVNNSNDECDTISISYDLEKFQSCDYLTFKLQKYGEYFNVLCEGLNRKKLTKNTTKVSSLYLVVIINVILKFLASTEKISGYSSTIIHSKCSLTSLNWCLMSRNQPRIPIKVWNAIVSKLVDLILGFVVLYTFLNYEQQILQFLNETTEMVILSLKQLLDVLMGSPIGLKLNHAFNTTLGIFFFYHISLWRAFVHFVKPFLYSLFYFLLFPAFFGLSFQAAIFEDLVKFCTVHVYCIYVYAARLYCVQINGLISLWRLFIGRKYNPLRKRVDSYQYNHHQMFIGTLAFTILLFLLPTTLLYYVVFTVFRLCIKSFSVILTYMRISLQKLPVFVMFLWIINSSRVSGTIILNVASEKNIAPFTLHATLKVLPLWTSIKTTLPESNFRLPTISWGSFFHSIFMGELL